MKRIKLLLFTILSLFIFSGTVLAASGNITVTGSTSAIKGNSVTFTVTMSSNVNIGSWQVDLDYDASFLKLTSSTAEAGGTYMVNSCNGTKSKSYTFTFKTLKTGTTKVGVSSYSIFAFDDMSMMTMKTSSKSIRIMTQEELEATYSSDATLKTLSIDGVELTPAFDKNVLEYSVEVENAITSVHVNAEKNDKNASVAGVGDYPLEEGANSIPITVTAQKGNQTVYTIVVNRKELEPIEINFNNKTYRLVRKPAELIQNNIYIASTTIYNEIEIPSLFNESLNITLVGLKDSENNVNMYIYKDGKIISIYNELTNNQTNIIPIELKEDAKFKKYKIVSLPIGLDTVRAYQLNSNDRTVIVYALDIATNQNNYYTYNLDTKTFMLETLEKDHYYDKIIKYYQYILLGCLGLIIILLLICIFKKGKKKAKKEKNKDPLIVEEIKVTQIEGDKPVKGKKKSKKEIKKEDLQ